MTYAPDLANTGAVKQVGYLWCGHSYPKGKIAGLILEQLVAIAEKPLFYACGFHKCIQLPGPASICVELRAETLGPIHFVVTILGPKPLVLWPYSVGLAA
jgi:hypothetical protein